MDSIHIYKQVLSRLIAAVQKSSLAKNTKMMAVSKKRSTEEILEVYNQGHRNFGENYANELIEKSKVLPSDINWFMIGHLQTNKCKKLLEVKNLFAIESVDSFKLAEEINNQSKKLDRVTNIYIQVNISKETTKSGIAAEETEMLVQEIVSKCDNVKVTGLMSLGTLGSTEEFTAMYQLKQKICNTFGFSQEEFTVSIGTSDDFEEAIACGSDEVRIGSLLFEK